MSLHRRRLLLSRGSISQGQDRESHCRHTNNNHTNNKTMSHLKYFPSSSTHGVQAIHRYFYVRTLGLSSTIPPKTSTSDASSHGEPVLPINGCLRNGGLRRVGV